MFNNSGDNGMSSFAFGDPQAVTMDPTMGMAGARRLQTARRGRGGPASMPVPRGETIYANFEQAGPSAAEADAGETQQPQGPPGSLLEVKRIDETYDMRNGVWSTRDSTTPTGGKKDKDTYAAYAFTINRRFQPTDNKGMHVVTTVLDVKSEHLREVGKDVIGQVQGISWTSKPLKVDPRVLMAFLPQLINYESTLALKVERASEEDASVSEKLAHLRFLTSFIRSEYAETFEELNSLLAHDEITFDLLWALLKPRTILYTPCPVTGSPRALRVRGVEICQRATPGVPPVPPVSGGDGPRFWAVDAEYIEYNAAFSNGSGQPKFGYAQLLHLEVPLFAGTEKITSLPFYPMVYYPGAEELEARLVERGKRWVGLQGIHHLFYDGLGFKWDSQERRYKKQTIRSRVMIDRETFAKTLANYVLPVVSKALTGEDIDKHPRKLGATSHATAQNGNETPESELSDQEIMLASPVVYGFSLTDKQWFEFDVDNVSTFEWNDGAFENLVLPAEQKDLIKSLAEAHTLDEFGFDDFIDGKGRGLIINLFGSPGVGKSLTAEAASEYVRKPLYVVGAGELGTVANVLDTQLTRIFNLAATWEALVLIDEADVFLEERSLHEIARNAMVAVFLRQLEYFRGILFLTTNRVRTFDEAFQSRIHVSLLYPDLSADAKRKIWIAMLKKVKPRKQNNAATAEAGAPDEYAGLTRSQLYELGEKKVNGRQIKNVVRTACAIASSKKEDVSYKYLIQVLNMIDQFDARSAMYQ